jgi:hypothetical protein
MLHRLSWIVLSLIIATSLSGCLVEKKKPSEITKLSRTTNKLHIYQAGESIDYNVTAYSSDGTISTGTLVVEWKSTGPLTDPILGTPISSSGAPDNPILEETSTLEFTSGNEAGATLIRYISQDSDGNITLHALSDGSNLYWPSQDSGSNPSAPISSPVIFGSPLAIGVPPLPVSPVEFYIKECELNSCPNALYKFKDRFTVDGDTTEITTNLGIFQDPFILTNYDGLVSSSNSGRSITLTGDIRDACADGDISKNIVHGYDAGKGEMYVMPEIGMIKMDSVCQFTDNSGIRTVRYLVTFKSTDISTPW